MVKPAHRKECVCGVERKKWVNENDHRRPTVIGDRTIGRWGVVKQGDPCGGHESCTGVRGPIGVEDAVMGIEAKGSRKVDA
jgi:hypothetical protein